jgi:arginine-tRNA-protein transferase
LAAGQRRHGALVYEPRCPNCQECISLRVLVDQFQPSTSQQRVWQRGQAKLTAKIGPPVVDRARLELLNRHSQWRGWRDGPDDVSAEFYEQIFVCSLFDSREIAYYAGSRLVAIAICDQGIDGVSAVYTFYDPAFAKWSLGTYSILFQLQYCRSQAVPFLYLGYYVADCQSLRYKANFRPHQRRLKGRWIEFP